ncbi:amino acid adenylation domain-containing protein [Streptomyces sp. NPDC058664]|uniref:amino acid adenylation domain-containing protein n=1 Tax=unclassified Streptomyces TaxID=2593676 RepID=UPI00365CEFFC
MLSIDDLRRVVTELLGSGAETPGDQDNLIELGLDSLKLMRIADRCRRTGLDIGFADLARRPTLAGWSDLLTEAEGAAAAAAPASDDTLSAATPAPTAVSPEPRDGEPFPLALMQHAYWVGRGGSQALGAVAAHLYTEFDGSGVDPARLGAAVAALAERHPMLRARVLDDGRQVIGAWTGGTALPVLDLRDASRHEVEEQTTRLREQLSHQLLDVEAGQVFDIRVTLLPEGRTRVHVDVDMLAADARSYRTLLADLVHLYERPERPLPPLDYTYAQYLAERRAQPPRDQDVRWWRERLGELPGAPTLPARPEAERGAVHRVTRLHHWLSPEQRARLTDQARHHAVTPAVAAATAFAEVLGAWSGEPRFLLNVPMFDRRPLHADVDRLVGDFTSSIMLDVDLTETRTFAERAGDAQDRMHRAAAHSSYSGVEVLRDLSREQGSQVLAPVVFTSALDLGELFGQDVERCLGEPAWIVSQGPQVLLDAQITELHDGLLVNWDVRADAFPDGTAEAMFAAFTDLMGRVADGTAWDVPVGPLATEAQLAVRAETNRTDGPMPEQPLHQAFFARAATTPDAPAVLAADSTTLTYGQLADRALRVAGALRARGVDLGDAVAIRLPKGPDQLVAVLGVHAAGAHYVPIGVEQPAARAESIRARAGFEVVLGAADGDATTLPLDEAAAWTEPLAAPLFADARDVAYVLFTSGSTGEPKGVEVSHRAAANTIDDLVERLGLGPADRTLALSALDFDLSVFDVFAPLSVGGAVVTVDERTRKDATAWTGLVRQHAVTVLNCVPSLLDMLLTAAEHDPMGTSLRAVLLGGDWVGVDLPVRLRAQVPGCRFLGLGGTTETAIHSTIQEVVGGEVPARWTSVPYGTPLRNVRCRVVDAQGRDCPDWVAGELWIGGAGVADGYRGDAERTADRFVEIDGYRWYRTGDRARYWPDGALEFLGRADDQVKIRGFRIELGEVEAALAQHPAVRQATALVLRTGPAPRLCAVVATGAGVGLDEDDLRAEAAERLPVHMLPDTIAVLDELPLTANGKTDRRALRELLAAQTKEGEREAARSSLEEVIARVWAGVLGADRVGRQDDYFQLGGDSILATRITAQLREALDTDDVSVHDVLSSLTVAELARTLAVRDADDRLELVAEIYLEIDSLSDEEIDAQLADAEGDPERADG